MVIGFQGVPLNYVIREDKTPNYFATVPYEEATIQEVALTSSELKMIPEHYIDLLYILYMKILMLIPTLSKYCATATSLETFLY